MAASSTVHDKSEGRADFEFQRDDGLPSGRSADGQISQNAQNIGHCMRTGPRTTIHVATVRFKIIRGLSTTDSDLDSVFNGAIRME